MGMGNNQWEWVIILYTVHRRINPLSRHVAHDCVIGLCRHDYTMQMVLNKSSRNSEENTSEFLENLELMESLFIKVT